MTKNFITSVVCATIVMTLFSPSINAQSKYRVSSSLTVGISAFTNSSNLSPLGLKYGKEFQKSARYADLMIVTPITKSTDIGILARG